MRKSTWKNAGMPLFWIGMIAGFVVGLTVLFIKPMAPTAPQTHNHLSLEK